MGVLHELGWIMQTAENGWSLGERGRRASLRKSRIRGICGVFGVRTRAARRIFFSASKSAELRGRGGVAPRALLIIRAGLREQAATGSVQAYLLGNWATPFGISLALDRLAAMMLVLTALVATGALPGRSWGRKTERS